jgi:hypothetical protein
VAGNSCQFVAGVTSETARRLNVTNNIFHLDGTAWADPEVKTDYAAEIARGLEDVFAEAERGDIKGTATALLRIRSSDFSFGAISDAYMVIGGAIQLVQATANQQSKKT